MDRISALRNVEETLSALERGEVDLATAEERVVGILRTYVTEFGDDERAAYRATGDPAADGLVVVAESRRQARDRVAALADAPDPEFDLEHIC